MKNVQQVVWITGGGSGIGRALAVCYAQLGWVVVVSGRREDKLLETKAIQPDLIHAISCDVTILTEVEKAVAQIMDVQGRLDLVIANAGYAQSGLLQDLSEADWRRQLDVNVLGAVNTAAVSIPHLEQTGGQVAFVSSVMAYCRFPKSVAYSASKAALTALAEGYMLELRSSKVTCSVIHPGFVVSEIGQIDATGTFDPSLSDRRPKRFMWRAEDAATHIQRRLARRQSHITVTWHGFFGLHMARLFPRLTLWLQQRFG